MRCTRICATRAACQGCGSSRVGASRFVDGVTSIIGWNTVETRDMITAGSLPYFRQPMLSVFVGYIAVANVGVTCTPALPSCWAVICKLFSIIVISDHVRNICGWDPGFHKYFSVVFSMCGSSRPRLMRGRPLWRRACGMWSKPDPFLGDGPDVIGCGHTSLSATIKPTCPLIHRGSHGDDEGCRQSSARCEAKLMARMICFAVLDRVLVLGSLLQSLL